jgi:hypothetical protein
LPAPEIAILKTPRNYHPLRTEHAKATAQPTKSQDQAPTPSQLDAENTRSRQKPSAPPVWAGTGSRESEETAAIHRNNRLNADAIKSQRVPRDASANISKNKATLHERDKATEKLTGKELHAADLQAAKQAGRAAGPQHIPDRNVSPQAAAKQEKLTGKALHAEDLKAAKESAKATDQSRDTSRSR